MKIKEGFLLRKVAEEYVVIPLGCELDLNKMIHLNETGAFLWKQLEQECELDSLVTALLNEYDVEEIVAKKHVDLFIESLKKNGFLE